MQPFDEPEYQRWAMTGARNLEMARLLARERFGEGAVFHAEMAAQCALKSLLHGVGRKAGRLGRPVLPCVAQLLKGPVTCGFAATPSRLLPPPPSCSSPVRCHSVAKWEHLGGQEGVLS